MPKITVKGQTGERPQTNGRTYTRTLYQTYYRPCYAVDKICYFCHPLCHATTDRVVVACNWRIRFVTKVLQSYLRYAGDADGRRPSAESVTHLSEYVLRLATRERWDLADHSASVDRLRRLMFDELSELAEMAALSSMTFVADSDTDVEQVRPSSREADRVFYR